MEAQQLLENGEMDLQRDREGMKAIRRGDWSAQDLRDWAMTKEKDLETAFTNSKLPLHADTAAIKQLLLDCLEAHYGTLGNAVVRVGWAEEALRDIDALLGRVRQQLYK